MNTKTYIFIVIAFINFSCSTESSSPYTYQQPTEENDGLETGTLEEVTSILKMQ